ncbi:MAG: hypothetical protein QOK15_360 [Nocardioidaceae bacterium]|nr:hypothetical protein [Nocardioidaceae bacterium]
MSDGEDPAYDGLGNSGSGGPGGYRVEQAFRHGGSAFTSHAAPLVLMTLALLLGMAALAAIGHTITGALIPAQTYNLTTQRLEGGGGGLFGIRTILTLFFLALVLALGLVLQAGLVRMALALTRGHKVGVGEAFRDLDRRQVTIAALVIAGLTFAGSILCVLPGILFLFLTSFTLFFVVDRGEDAVTAIRSSVRLVGSHSGALVVFFLATTALYVVGACLCGLGLLVAVPVVTCAQAYTFHRLLGDPIPR